MGNKTLAPVASYAVVAWLAIILLNQVCKYVHKLQLHVVLFVVATTKVQYTMHQSILEHLYQSTLDRFPPT